MQTNSIKDIDASLCFWEQNNPYVICKDSHNRIRPVRNIFTKIKDLDLLLNDEIEDVSVSQFIIEGEKFGCVNCYDSSTDERKIGLCKKLYSDWIYIVCEEKAHSPIDPMLRLSRKVLFFNDYRLAVLNKKYFVGSFNDPKAIEKDANGNYTIKLTEFDRIAYKLVENKIQTKLPYDVLKRTLGKYDILLECDSNEEAEKKFYATEKEYFSDPDREQLTPREMLVLFFMGYSNLINSLSSRPQPIAPSPNKHGLVVYEFWPFFQKLYTNDIDNNNIVGCGWLPLVFAKKEKNQLDQLIIDSWENRSNVC